MRAGLASLRDTRGASAAEFALLLPLSLLFLLGIIDAGRYAWEYNQAEKATQIGARWAVVTDLIPGGGAVGGLYRYSFAEGSGVPQGTVVGSTDFPGVVCQTVGATATLGCTCKASCAFGVAIDTAAQNSWNGLVGRMAEIYPNIRAQNVRIDYDWSGLGFSGDPNGPDVAPLVTVSLRNEPTNRINFQPITTMLFSGTLPIPSAGYTLTMEDAKGTDSN